MKEIQQWYPQPNNKSLRIYPVPLSPLEKAHPRILFQFLHFQDLFSKAQHHNHPGIIWIFGTISKRKASLKTKFGTNKFKWYPQMQMSERSAVCGINIHVCCPDLLSRLTNDTQPYAAAVSFLYREERFLQISKSRLVAICLASQHMKFDAKRKKSEKKIFHRPLQT